MSVQLYGSLGLREYLAKAIKDADKWILTHCFYCKNCRLCAINSRLHKELNRNGFKTFNKHINWWKLTWVDDLPVLRPER